MQKHGNRFGTHRVIEPKGVLPQPANKLDNNMDEIYDNEILIDVQTLNIDSASFTDIHNYAKAQAKDPNNEAEVMEEIKKEMLLNVELQGKHRNRRTGSGGMLLGKVEKIGDAYLHESVSDPGSALILRNSIFSKFSTNGRNTGIPVASAMRKQSYR